MAIAIVNTGSAAFTVAVGGASGDVTTTGVDSSGGNLAVILGIYNGTGAPATDSKGNAAGSWSGLTGQDSFGNKSRLWYFAAPTVGTSHTVTLTGGTKQSIGVLFASGAHATPYTSQQSGVGSTSGTSKQPGSITPSEDGCIMVAGVARYSSTSGAVDSPFTGVHANGTTNDNGISMAHDIQTTATARNPTFSWSGSVVCSAVMAVFKPAAGGGGGGTVGNTLSSRVLSPGRIFGGSTLKC